ncbi:MULTISPECIES: phage virion morphogenesis protein [Pseudomonas]|uniref:phage virion morphogenesis protein n=1 Tax=Pseudomonas TaxID=286 RepID=UPI00123C20DE|nr:MULTISPECIES: phage virion morphogenesis protein [Pseudomonas]QEU31535.1 phage virion morphogenesis protein [Pseudomonas luteola]
MIDDLTALETWLNPLLAKLEPQERTKLAREAAREIRKNQTKRITAQKNPDGSAFEKRKPRDLRSKQGRIKKKMFMKLKMARYLKAQGSEQAVTVGFTGRIARIARVHQYGLKDRAERGAPNVHYARRELLGLSEDELKAVRDLIIDHIKN